MVAVSFTASDVLCVGCEVDDGRGGKVPANGDGILDYGLGALMAKCRLTDQARCWGIGI